MKLTSQNTRKSPPQTKRTKLKNGDREMGYPRMNEKKKKKMTQHEMLVVYTPLIRYQLN